MFGYAGQLLEVDLTKRMTSVKKISPDFCRKFVGGLGFAARLSLEIEKNAKPLSPENHLILAVGPLTGTLVPSNSGTVFVTKSPINNGFCYDVLYASFAIELRNANYDAIIIKGKADYPVFLSVDNNRRQIKDAQHLMGKSPRECEENIRKALGDPFVEVVSIGVAGERMVSYAGAVCNQTKMVGKGIGAVMGSKNLKAIAVRGTNKLSLAMPQELYDFSLKALRASRKIRGVGDWKFGTLFNASRMNSNSAPPMKNFRASVFPEVDNLIQNLNEQYLVKVNSCPLCPLACEHIYRTASEDYGETGVNLGYDAFWAFGPNCGINQIEPILTATELCYSYGLDIIQAGGVISFLMECSESKLGKENSLGELRFGDSKALLEMLHRIASREDVGNLLAEGSNSIIKTIEGSERLRTSVKGFQLPGCDPRVSTATMLQYSVSPCAEFPLGHGVITEDINKLLRPQDSKEETVKIVKNFEDMVAFLHSLVLCLQTADVFGSLENIAKAYTLVTGIELDAESIRCAAERIHNIIRFFNNREGFDEKNDMLPSRFFSPDAPLTMEEFESLLHAYYEKRGWTAKGIVPEDEVNGLILEEVK